MARALIIPYALWVLVDYAHTIQQSSWQYTLLIILGLLLNTWIAVTVHRLVLIGKSSVPTWGLSKISSRETLFFLYASVLYLLIVSLVYLNYYLLRFGVHSAAIMVFIVVFMTLILIRLSLVFPAIATDQRMTFPQSWRITLPYQLPLFITLIIFPLALSVPMYAFKFIPEPPRVILTSLLDVLIEILFIATLSTLYRRICEHQ